MSAKEEGKESWERNGKCEVFCLGYFFHHFSKTTEKDTLKL